MADSARATASFRLRREFLPDAVLPLPGLGIAARRHSSPLLRRSPKEWVLLPIEEQHF